MLTWLRTAARRITVERLGWFGAGLSAAAVGVVGYQLLWATSLGNAIGASLPGPQPTSTHAPTPSATPTRTPRASATPYPSNTPRPTRPPTRTPSPTRTASPTRTPVPTRTPSPTSPLNAPDLLATMTSGDTAGLIDAVATFAARTSDALEAIQVTPRPR